MNDTSETAPINPSGFVQPLVLVTGGSGFNGINLIRYLLPRGYRIRSLDLLPFDYADCRDQIEAIVGDIRDPLTVERAMKGVDLVVHCAMALPLYPAHDILTMTMAKINGATMEASDSTMKRGVSTASLPQVIFSLGTAPE